MIRSEELGDHSNRNAIAERYETAAHRWRRTRREMVAVGSAFIANWLDPDLARGCGGILQVLAPLLTKHSVRRHVSFPSDFDLKRECSALCWRLEFLLIAGID